ncbi:cation transporter [Anaerobacillus alkalidiazotrophicus]|uniref:Cation transporter n=1 Tax=Anaerobacillus alkalidiazotrophicus TaxID=472963 RepID=A0A1S2M5M5_9BACI|nr:sodium:calcium antiporter [Anaerobacillus alkalidiazotrophicus]OIJ18492.1 cation transporter [Anaerobacillus alkalidiazotrophicus]OIJ19971.1 cation transporter [Anaerobacillus alkalidiazotrophicus]
MVFLLFFIAAIFTVLSAIKLSTYADVLSERTSLGGMLVGTIFLAGATSLPEVTTTLTAIVGLKNTDLAVGSVLGSNMFNLLIIAAFDLYYRKNQIFKSASHSHVYTISVGMLLSCLIFLALTLKLPYSILGIGFDTIILIIIYASGMYLISKKVTNFEDEDEDKDGVSQTSAISLKKAIIGFIIAAFVILISGSLLSITGDRIAIVTGLGSSFVGSFLIAASTSLPEAVAVLIAIQLRNYNLAIGSILGSNLFNILILIGSDVFYRPASILSAASSVHSITAIATFLLSVIILYSLLRSKVQKNQTVYWLPSAVLIFFYFVSSFLIFIN